MSRLEALEKEREDVLKAIRILRKQDTGMTAPIINNLLRRLRNIHCNINQQRQRWSKTWPKIATREGRAK